MGRGHTLKEAAKINRVSIKLVEADESTLAGMVRFSAAERVKGAIRNHQIKGICGWVQANHESIYFNTKELFYYGTEWDMLNNYFPPAAIPLAEEQWSVYLDRPYAMGTYWPHWKNSQWKNGFFKIPMGCLSLPSLAYPGSSAPLESVGTVPKRKYFGSDMKLYFQK